MNPDIFSVSVTSLLLRPPSCHVPCSASSLCANFPVCPLEPSAIPLLAVCYSCWSNLENVPNPLSVLLPQRNTKWIRRDYRLPLPPPLPSSSSSSSPSCHSPLSIPLAPVRALVAPIFLRTFLIFIGRIKAFSLFGRQIGSSDLPSDRCSHRPKCIMGHKVLLIKLWPLKLEWETLTWHNSARYYHDCQVSTRTN